MTDDEKVASVQDHVVHAVKDELARTFGRDFTVVVVVSDNTDGGDVHVASTDIDYTAPLLRHVLGGMAKKRSDS